MWKKTTPQNTSETTPETTSENRRSSIRLEPPGLMPVNIAAGGLPIPDAELLNLSVGGAALSSPSPLIPGERVAFNVGGGRAPVLCQVLDCTRQDDGSFHIRCKCVLGGFDLDAA